MARMTAQRLKEIPFSVAFTSPLMRAKETAQIIMHDRIAPIVEDERIAELAFGDGEGMRAKVDGAYVSVFEDFFCHPERYKPLSGGETLEQLCKRTEEFWNDLIHREEWQDQTILVTTHGAAMRGILHTIRKETMENFWMGNLIGNCAVTIVDVEKGEATVVEDGKIFYEIEKK